MAEWCLAHPWMTFILLLVLFSSLKIHFGVGAWQKEIRLANRIHELEEILCPCEQHDWVKVGQKMVGGTGHGDEQCIERYVCRKCKKEKEM